MESSYKTEKSSKYVSERMEAVVFFRNDFRIISINQVFYEYVQNFFDFTAMSAGGIACRAIRWQAKVGLEIPVEKVLSFSFIDNQAHP